MTSRSDRTRLALIVWGVLVSQVFLYPGLEDTVAALGGGDEILAGTWFLVAEFGAFVGCAVVWGLASDALGRRTPLVVLGAIGGAASYVAVALVPQVGLGFGAVLLLRVVGGAFTIGAFSLSITMLMDLSGGHGRNMGAAGTAIGLGAALGSVVGGQFATIDPLAPLYGGAVILVGAAVLAATIPDRSPGDGRPVGTLVERVRTRPTLLVPFAFGYIDRLTAGFFALTGVAYFRDTFGLDAAQAGLTLALFFRSVCRVAVPRWVVVGSNRAVSSGRHRIAVLRRDDHRGRTRAHRRTRRWTDGRRRRLRGVRLADDDGAGH